MTDDFPESAPKISVDRKYSHHLLDDNGVVTKLPDLQKWSAHSDLGNIVQKIQIYLIPSTNYQTKFSWQFSKTKWSTITPTTSMYCLFGA